ncbi:N-acyl-D-amino-acid deacylase family protein [Belnapia rosea]|uniref:N-acyl-D-aspartate/D-glutamate deacylase n=1 Tax=Belnapia rosea TaxID=938405 RepID=A0A1G6LSN0_9PROT|nr:amidohydrolase family protein [Belnapia rosea]SDB46218.1 N-acyl-D-aspartate/D-glutamate deacylase [Belnapia rosea]SDC46260.1 N-acyl-D-aspartate/D-glutamate deacylase [Belnapia rosea]
MHDLVIRGGTIIDGTGAPGFTGDLAIDGDRIASVGGKAGPGRREVRAEGRLVTPGWVDVHTHYDGQATWDPVLAPSSWHGATTILFGNCGVGFAPVRPAHHQALIDLMEGVEDIPGIALAEGLKWDWESFPDYLDALSRLPRTIDVAAQIAHHPLRVYAMGERAIAREMATAEDIELMARLTEEALRAGAFGFTTSRTDQHKTPAGELVPGRYAEHEELIAIGKAMGRAGRGAFGMLSDFEDEAAEFGWLRQVAADSRRPVWFLLTDRSYDPDRWRRLMDGVRAARSDGLALSAQVAGRPVGLILGLATSLNPFALREGFAELARLSPAEQLARLREPAVRADILAQEASPRLMEILPPLSRQIATRWDRMYILGDTPDYEPPPERSIAALAAGAGQSPEAYCYDYLTGGDGGRMLYFPVTNYVHGDLEVVREMIEDPNTVLGLSDGGAHCGVICDASLNTTMLTHWVRDRSRGPRLPLEFVIKRQTSETADFFGFHDRGRLAVGKKADVNVIDFAALRPHHPEMAFDLPAGGRRLIQHVDGYDMTICSGVPIFERGEETGARPGRLVRATG